MAVFVKPVSPLSITFIDHSDELSNVTLNMTRIDAANFDAQVLLKVALITAVDAISLCNLSAVSMSVLNAQYTDGAPANPLAQREIALQVGLMDSVTGKKSHFSIPGVDWPTFANSDPNAKDFIDQSKPAWIALVAAVQNAVLSPEGNPVIVQYGKLVGRRS